MAACGGKIRKIPLGMQSYTFRDHLTSIKLGTLVSIVIFIGIVLLLFTFEKNLMTAFFFLNIIVSIFKQKPVENSEH